MSWFFGPDDPGWELLPYDLQTRVHFTYLKVRREPEPDLDDEPLLIRDEAGNEWLI